jgi:hypothetical protein
MLVLRLSVGEVSSRHHSWVVGHALEIQVVIGLTLVDWVDLGWFYYFFNLFFSVSSFIVGLFRIEFCIFFRFALHGIILILWSRLQVWQVRLSSFFLIQYVFLLLCHLTPGWLEINLHNLFWFAFRSSSQSHNQSHMFGKLTRNRSNVLSS